MVYVNENDVYPKSWKTEYQLNVTSVRLINVDDFILLSNMKYYNYIVKHSQCLFSQNK